MIYQAYGAQANFLDLVRPLAAAAGTMLRLPWPLLRQGWPLCKLAGALETFANLTVIHDRDVPFAEGRFDFSAFVDHVVEFLQVMGAGSHVVAVCQPCVPVLAAAALMAEDGDEAQPRSMTLMAGPVDTRINPTKVNELASKWPISWFEQNLDRQSTPRLQGRSTPSLSRFHAARGVHEHES